METATQIKFSDQSLAKIRELITHYPIGKQKSALLPILHMAQEELGNGWLPVEVMDYCAEILNIQPIEVYEVASFYTMFNLKPVGKYVIEVCRTSPCCHRGAEELMDYMQQKLGVKLGENTKDGMFTVKAVECLAGCGYAPVVQIGDHYYEHLTKEKIDALIEKMRNSNPDLHNRITI